MVGIHSLIVLSGLMMHFSMPVVIFSLLDTIRGALSLSLLDGFHSYGIKRSFLLIFL